MQVSVTARRACPESQCVRQRHCVLLSRYNARQCWYHEYHNSTGNCTYLVRVIHQLRTDHQQNVILNAWCLVISLVGTLSVDKWGRKPTAILTQISLTVFLFIVGGLTKGESNLALNISRIGMAADIALQSMAHPPTPRECMVQSQQSFSSRAHTLLAGHLYCTSTHPRYSTIQSVQTEWVCVNSPTMPLRKSQRQ